MSESGTGQQLFVLGHPVAHSKSPALHNALYRAMGLSWEYGLADLPTPADAQEFLAARRFLGVNVTMPYKPVALAEADAKASSAKLALGANVLAVKDGRLVAYNTDGHGCVMALERTGFRFEGASVVVCGTGPTSLSILHACAVAGAQDVVLLSRSKDRAQSELQGYADRLEHLARAASALPTAALGRERYARLLKDVRFRFGAYDTSRQALEGADLIVNATPLGMGEDDPAPFDTALLHGDQTVLQAVYGHGTSALERAARQVGAAFFDGRGMLVGQAVATARILFDLNEVPCDLSDGQIFDIMAQGAGFDL
uniref:Shikimate dehydrogenase n=1 Tax=Muribaculaceae bacterium Z82 TaxID=2304548 RepID=A0A7C9JML5_9BACT